MSEENGNEFLAMLDDSLPDTAAESLRRKGVPIRVPHSSTKRPPALSESAYTKRWPLNKKAKKKRLKTAKQSRRRNRK